ncbi:MAG: stage II sporulation protein P [Oscillospiraceae bacterium]|jgi:stage II sporulation protein P
MRFRRGAVGLKKGIAVVALLALGLRLATLSGAGIKLGNWLRDLAESGQLISAVLTLEFGKKAENPQPAEAEEAKVVPPKGESLAVFAAASPQPGPQEEAAEEVLPENEHEVEIVETTISGGLTISNDTGYEIDVEAIMSEPLTQKLPAEGPQVLIIHTHGSEAYTPDFQDSYIPTDNCRTEDINFNVVRVGAELAAELEKCGLNVIHDTNIYDYPSYTGSYNRSGQAIENYLAQYPGIAVIIDVHRDALGTGDVIYKTVAAVQGECSSQVMLLVGTGENGLPHPNWRENLKLALYLQAAVNAKYQTLTRPVSLKKERYNQHLTTGSLILEVGSSGNTLQEALTAVRLFASAAGPALLELAEEG